MSMGHSGTVIVSVRQCGTSYREHATVPDSDSGVGRCWTVLASMACIL